MHMFVTLTGVAPLLCHNIQLADPDNRWSRQISEITKKRKKTDDDRREIGRLEWFGSLYTHQGKIIIPTANILKCFIETAKVTKEGRSVTRAVAIIEPHTRLIYNGPDDPEELWQQQEFRDSTLVGIGKQRIVRMRPIFRAWMVKTEFEVLTEVMDYDAITKIIRLAGRVEGLGDNRVNGYGRFTAEIESSDEMSEAA